MEIGNQYSISSLLSYRVATHEVHLRIGRSFVDAKSGIFSSDARSGNTRNAIRGIFCQFSEFFSLVCQFKPNSDSTLQLSQNENLQNLERTGVAVF